MSLKGLVIIDAYGNRYKVVPDSTPTDERTINLPNLINSQKQSPPVTSEDFRTKLKEFRESAGISQTTLAKTAGTKQPNIAAIESGKRKARPATQTTLIAALEKLSKRSWK